MRTCSRCGKAAASISPRRKRCRSGPSGFIFAALTQLVRVLRAQIQPVDRAQRFDLAQCRGRERRLALEGVQDDALEQVTEGEIELGRERLEDLEEAALEPDPGLGTGHLLHVPILPWYQVTSKPLPVAVSEGRGGSRAGAACWGPRRGH